MKVLTSLPVSIGILCSVLCSCGSHEQNADDERVIEEWLGKEIIIDPNVGYFTTRGDTSSIELPRCDFKLVRYIGGTGCTSCSMHIHKYAEILKTLSDSAQTEVGFICIVHPGNYDELRHTLKLDNRDNLPVFIDQADSLNKLNDFPKSERLRTFLVDRDNRVLGLGDPSANPNILKYYCSILTDDSINAHKLPMTNLAMFPADMNIGKIAAGDSVVGEFHVGNIGKEPFVLSALVPSCECVTATLSSDTIWPRCDAILRVVFSEDEPIGNFFREVEIVGNIPNEFTLRIKGTVVSR